MIRRCSILLVVVASTLSLHAQRSQRSSAEVHITVTFEDNHNVPQMTRVVLLTSMHMPIGEQFANDRGQVSFRVSSGSYIAQATSIEAEPAEISFAVQPRESMHSDYIYMKHKAAKDGTGDSHEGSISTAALNIPDKARKEFEKGLTAFDKDDLSTARERFSKAVELYPQYALALVNLGVIAMKQGDAVHGESFFEQAIKADPQMPNGYTSLARVKIMQAKYDSADTLLEKALSIRPLDPEPLTMLATSQSREGKYDEAIVTAKKVHSVPHEHYAVCHIIAAESMMRLKEPDQAADEYRLFLKEFPTSPNADSVRAALHSLENQMQ